MTSSDGGDPRPGGRDEGGRRNVSASDPAPQDEDPVRLTPPVDPWLAEAATSVLDDATPSGPSVVPPDDPVPYAHLAGGASPAGPPPGWTGRPPRRRRGRRWVVAILAVCALFVAGSLAVDQFGADDDGDTRGSAPSVGVVAGPTRTGAGQVRTPAGAAAPEVSTGTLEVVYRVTASGSRNVGSVSYTDQDGEIIRLSGIALPWRVTFPVGARRKPLVLIAQRLRGGDAGPVTCTITVGGKLLSSTTAEGRYAAPQCSGSG